MSLDLVVEVWDALRSHVDLHERKDAAGTLINLLIDNNYEADDIKDSFKGDKDILGALKYYIDQHDQEEEYDDEEEDSDEEWN
jgi:hypothetical protein